MSEPFKEPHEDTSTGTDFCLCIGGHTHWEKGTKMGSCSQARFRLQQIRISVREEEGDWVMGEHPAICTTGLLLLLFLLWSCHTYRVSSKRHTLTCPQAGDLKCQGRLQQQGGGREWWGLGQTGELILRPQGAASQIQLTLAMWEARSPLSPQPVRFQEKCIYLVFDEISWFLNDNEFHFNP